MSQPGVIPPPFALSDGVAYALRIGLAAAGFGGTVATSPDGLHVSDVPTARFIIDTYVGSAAELSFEKIGKLGRLEAAYASKYADCFSYAGTDGVKRSFQIDQASLFNTEARTNAALGSMLDDEPWDVGSYFIAADNTHMPTPTAASMRAFGLAVRTYVASLILRNRALKDEIGAAPDTATLSAIDLTVGWP